MKRFRSGGQNIYGGQENNVKGLRAGIPVPAADTHRDYEGQCGDHLQDEGHAEYLLPDVALGGKGASAQVGQGQPGDPLAHLVAEVYEQHCLQEADHGHDDLGDRVMSGPCQAWAQSPLYTPSDPTYLNGP